MAILKKLLKHQGAILQAPYVFPECRFFFLTAGYAAGKSSSLGDCILSAVKYFSGHKDKEGKLPKILLGGINLTFLLKTVSGALEQILKSTHSVYRWDKAHNIIEVAGVQILLIPIEDEGTIFGFDCCACFLDELDELPTYTSTAVVKAVNDRCRQIIPGCRPPWITAVSTSQGLKGMYQSIMEFRKQGIGYVRIKARTRDNTYLPKEYIASMYSIYNEKERKCYLEGEFISVDTGRVFPDYDPAVNDLSYDLYDTVKEGESVYAGMDFNNGYNKCRVALVRNGIIYIIKEYTFPDWRHAPEVLRYDFPRAKIFLIPDMTYKDHFSEFKKELALYKIRIVLRPHNPMVSDRVFAINKMFHLQRMFVCPFCKETHDDLLKHENDKKTGMPMKGQTESAPDHGNDCIGYFTSYLLAWNREFKDLYKQTLGWKESRRTGEMSEQMSDGTVMI